METTVKRETSKITFTFAISENDLENLGTSYIARNVKNLALDQLNNWAEWRAKFVLNPSVSPQVSRELRRERRKGW